MARHRGLMLLTFSLYILHFSEGAKFVGIVFPVKGQLIELQTLLLGVVDRGHDGYLVIGEHALPHLPSSITDSTVKVLTFKTRSADFMLFDDPQEQRDGLLAFFDDPYQRIFPSKLLAFRNKVTKLMTTDYTEDMLKDEYFNNRIRDLKIDMMILHNAFGFFPTSYLLPYKHNIPYITSSFLPHPLSGISLPPSFVPHPFGAGFTDKMTFLQRVANFLLNILIGVAMKPERYPRKFFTDYLPGLPEKSFSELVSRSELFIVTGKHPVLDYPQISMPNTIFAGGMNTKPGKPLNNELQTFMDGHKNGVIVVSFGSLVNYMPANIEHKLLSAFAQIDYGVIWRYYGPIPSDVPSHIKLSAWIPQNDLLAQPNIKLFVSHCGNGGSFEALYHGIPILGFPLSLDQAYNGNRAKDKGMAVIMDITDFTVNELVDNINGMIQNSTYYETAHKLSTIYRDQPMTPQQKSAYWIQHVLKYGGSYLRSPSADMPWYKYYSVDVIVFLLVVFISIMILFVTCWKLLCVLFCRRHTVVSIEKKTD